MTGAVDAAETVSVQVIDSTATEGPNADNGIITIKRATAVATPLTVYLTSSGSATRNVDYGAIPASVVIPANSTSVTIYINPIEDLFVESSETVVATITSNAAYTIGSPNSGTVNLRDDEATEVSLSASDNAAAEQGLNIGTFTVTRKGGAAAALYVPVIYAGTAGEGSDYQASNAVAYFAPFAGSAVLTIAPIDDTTVEPDETVIATVQPANGYRITGSITATVTLADNETPVVSVVASDAAAAETGSNTGAFRIDRLGNKGPAITVAYSMGGSAASGTDYTLTGTATIAANQTSTTFTVTPSDDAVAEGNETVVMTLTGGTGYALGAQISASITLGENEQSIWVAATDRAGYEPGTDKAQFTIYRASTSLGSALPVSYTVTGTALSGSDYTTLSGSATISANATSTTITVTPLNDSLTEVSETVSVTLTSNSAYVIKGSPTATVDIGDNETALPTLNAYTYGEVAEASGGWGFYFVLSAVNTTDVTVWYQTSGTATSETDYSPLPGTVIIPAGHMSASIWLTTVNDTLNENSETVILTLLPSGSYLVGSPAAVTTTIIDDEAPTVMVTANDGTASEPGRGDGEGMFTFTRTGPVAAPLTIPISISGSALPGFDFAQLPSSVTIPNGSSSTTLAITPIDDALAEPSETIVLVIKGGTAYTVSGTNTVTVTLRDDEVGITSIVTTDATATEGGDTATFTLSRVGNLSSAITVPLTVSGTASSGVDFTALPVSVALGANAASATVTLTSINDALQEVPEAVTVTLGSGSGYTLGSPLVATATIIDDEQAVSIQVADLYAREGGSPGAFVVQRTGSLSAALTINLQVTGSAIVGTHYVALPSSVVIEANASSAIIPVVAINDATWRAQAMVQLSVVAGAYAIASPSIGTVLTVDNDNAPPVVVVRMQTPNQTSTTLTLDASSTTDPNSDALTYRWSIYGAGVLSTTAQLAYDFKLLAGLIIELVVSDGKHSVKNYYPVTYVNVPTTIDEGDFSRDRGVLLVDNATLTLNGAHQYLVGRVINSGVVTHSPCTYTTQSTMSLTIDQQLFVDGASRIDATGKGLPPDMVFTILGPTIQSTMYTYSGASHGGYGASYSIINGGPDDLASEVYGVFDDPITVGSGGGTYNLGNGNAGGGCIRLTAGSLSLNGSLLANGQGGSSGGSDYAGGSAGGSVNVTVGTFSGTGPIQAQGSNSVYAPGGGGRIAVRYTSGTIATTQVSAAGGYAGNRSAPDVNTPIAGAGTVYLHQTGQNPRLILDNKLTAAPPESVIRPLTPWYFASRWTTLDDPATFPVVLVVAGRANVAIDQTPTAIACKNPSSVNGASLQGRNLVAEDFPVTNGSVVTNQLTATNLTLTATSSIKSFASTASAIETLQLGITGTVTIDATSVVDVTGRGCPTGYRWSATGPKLQAATMQYASGSYGGHGADGSTTVGFTSPTDLTNDVYGSFFNPNEVGSGGGSYLHGGAGGGLIRITANSLVLNGKLLANAPNLTLGGSNYCGGSGGGINVAVSAFSGSGAMQAIGSDMSNLPGGGGRIAVFHASGTVDVSKLSAAGGYYDRANPLPYNYGTGSAGTVFVQKTGSVYGQLRIDNAGMAQTRPTLIFVGTPTSPSGTQPVPPVDITITSANGGTYQVVGDLVAFDADRDGLVSWEEQAAGTNPRDADSNDNGIADGVEVRLGLPALGTDSDGDGVANAIELARGTDPMRADTDGDGVSDATDVFPTDPSSSSWPAPPATDTTPPTITVTSPAGVIKL